MASPSLQHSQRSFATATSTEGRNIYQGRSEEEERYRIVKLRINCLRELDPDDIPAQRRGGVGRAELLPLGIQSGQDVCCLETLKIDTCHFSVSLSLYSSHEASLLQVLLTALLCF